MNKYRKCVTGFTLTELIITIAVMGIVMAIALPNFREIMINSLLTSAVNSMIGTLQLARSEAIKQIKYVGIQPKNGQDWQNGWMVFVDEADSATPDEHDGDELILQNYDALKTVTMTMSEGFIPVYHPNGRIKGIAGSFTFCHPSDLANFRRIIIANTGRVRVESPKNAQSPCS